jgi:hypothetical protein
MSHTLALISCLRTKPLASITIVMHTLLMNNDNTKVARIEYTVETRGGSAVRKAKDVPCDKVDFWIERIENKGGFNFAVKCEG